MAVALRLKRFGRLNHPTFRVVAADSRAKRDGRIIETLGFYLPKQPREAEQFKLNAERVKYWLSVGAKPSETVVSLIKKSGIALPARKPRKRVAKPWTPPKKKNAKARTKPKTEDAGTKG
ncbi:MAG TPA: 30S ribosomal protein S16 [Planctomycetota bacterium]|nr:30S ribosomal protein S16 [Planctomycetota bacterium]